MIYHRKLSESKSFELEKEIERLKVEITNHEISKYFQFLRLFTYFRKSLEEQHFTELSTSKSEIERLERELQHEKSLNEALRKV
jgi:hypothetical protein